MASPKPKGSLKSSLMWFVIIWVAIAAVVYVTVGQDEPATLLGVAGAALLSFLLMMKTMLDQWEGTIEEIKTEKVYVKRGDDDDGYYQDQTFAYVRLISGKRKKMRTLPAWQVGTHLRKSRGLSQIEVVESTA